VSPFDPREREDILTVELLRGRTRTGRPLGDDSFIDRLESLTHRIPRPRKAGRPRKNRRQAEKYG